METVVFEECFDDLHQVPSLPKRNGNEVPHLIGLTGSRFPAYLRGMETGLGNILADDRLKFPAYLRGMETRHVNRSNGDPKVPSLPKRNGNFLRVPLFSSHDFRSQPT